MKQKYSKKRWNSTNTKKEPSIKIRIHGQLTASKLAEKILEELANLEGETDQLYKNCNLYMTPTEPAPEYEEKVRVIEVKETPP